MRHPRSLGSWYAKQNSKMQTNTRQIGDVIVLDVSGRITLGEGNVMLREIVRDLAEKGNKRIVLNLGEVHYIDSSGWENWLRPTPQFGTKGAN